MLPAKVKILNNKLKLVIYIKFSFFRAVSKVAALFLSPKLKKQRNYNFLNKRYCYFIAYFIFVS
jgi:hypothetical protein